MFRPTLETLEKRELFAADLTLAAVAAATVATAEASPVEDVALRLAEQVEGEAAAVTVPKLDGNSKDAAYVVAGRGQIVGDWNGDGADVLSSQITSDGAFIEPRFAQSLLPYIEQDNLYKQVAALRENVLGNASARDALFADLGRLSDRPLAGEPQGIIAILIGLLDSPPTPRR
jgi:hypothetical protein